LTLGFIKNANKEKQFYCSFANCQILKISLISCKNVKFLLQGFQRKQTFAQLCPSGDDTQFGAKLA